MGRTRPGSFSPAAFWRSLGLPPGSSRRAPASIASARRGFTPNDDAGAPQVVIVDDAIARRFFPGRPAVGQRIQIPSGAGGDIWAEIVGVSASVKSDGPVAAPRPDLYLPFAQVPVNNFFVHLRTTLDVAAAGALLKQAVREIDPDVPVTEQATMQQVIDRPAASRRFPLALLGTFAALALLLAAVGIYAVTAYGVAQRTREIGVRMALGAQPRAIAGLVLRQSFRPIIAGLAVGLVGAVLTALAMRTLLFDVAPLDPPTFAAVSLLLSAVAFLACLLPARRATRVDPMIALRSE